MSEGYDSLEIAERVAIETASQPELFGPGAFSGADLGVIRVARRGTYSGAITCRDEAMVAKIVALRQQGASFRAIERATGTDRRVVSAVLQYAEKRQEIAPLKEVVMRRMAEVTERAIDRLSDELDKEEADPQMVRALGVVAGVGSDKLAAASQVAGELHLHQHVHLEGQDPTRDWLRARAAALATESKAAAGDGKSLQVNGSTEMAAALAASAGAVDPQLDPPAAGVADVVVDIDPAPRLTPAPPATASTGGRGGSGPPDCCPG